MMSQLESFRVSSIYSQCQSLTTSTGYKPAKRLQRQIMTSPTSKQQLKINHIISFIKFTQQLQIYFNFYCLILQFVAYFKLKLLKYWLKSAMSAKGPFLDCRWSPQDKSVYNIYYPILNTESLPTLVSQVIISQYVKIGNDLGWVTELTETKIKIQATINGTVIGVNPIVSQKIQNGKVLIFSIRSCEHFPKNKNQGQQYINKSILQTADTCALCDEPLWYYYDKQQKQVTFRQLKQQFSQFQVKDFDWKLQLNEQFTRDTQIGGTYDQSYRILSVGKVTFMYKFKQTQPTPSTVVLKYKNVICKHELVSSAICVFCLVDVRTLKNVNFRRFLFQFDRQNYQQDVVISGKALQSKALQFKSQLLKNKKALLVLDLDNTILHSISLKRIDQQMIKSISQYAIIPPGNSIFIEKTLVKFRPGFGYFLSKAVDLFQIFIYTKGTRLYAEQICRVVREIYHDIVGKTKNFLPHRIISRDQDDNLSKKSLQYIIPNNKDFILILDDRRDVWSHSPLCIFTRPYVFFYYAQITSDGKTKLQPVQWQKGGGTLQHKLSPKQEEKLKQIQKIEINADPQICKRNFSQIVVQLEQKIKQYQQIRKQIECEKNQISKHVVCKPQQIDQQLQNDTNKSMIKQNGAKIQQIKQKQLTENVIINTKKYEQPPRNLNTTLKNNSHVPDEYLITTIFALKQAHTIYFQKIQLGDDEQKKQGIYADICFSFHQHKKTILQHLSGFFIAKDYKKTSAYRRSIKLGLKIAESSCQKIDIIIRPNNFATNISQVSQDLQNKYYNQAIKKMKSMAQTKQIPIVSESWIDVCYEYNTCIHHKYFIPQDVYARTIFMSQVQMEKVIGLATMDSAQKIKQILKDQNQYGISAPAQ